MVEIRLPLIGQAEIRARDRFRRRRKRKGGLGLQTSDRRSDVKPQKFSESEVAVRYGRHGLTSPVYCLRRAGNSVAFPGSNSGCREFALPALS